MASAYAYHALSLPPSSPQGIHARSSFLPRRQLNPTGGSLAFPKKAFRVGTAPPPRLRVLSSRETKPAVVTGDSWKSLILNSESPVLVEFYASWCGPCRMVHRVVDEIAREYAGRMKCFVVDTDSDHQLAVQHDIKAVPVVLLFKNGEKCNAIVGTMPKEFYVAAIDKALAS